MSLNPSFPLVLPTTEEAKEFFSNKIVKKPLGLPPLKKVLIVNNLKVSVIINGVFYPNAPNMRFEIASRYAQIAYIKNFKDISNVI